MQTKLKGCGAQTTFGNWYILEHKSGYFKGKIFTNGYNYDTALATHCGEEYGRQFLFLCPDCQVKTGAVW